MFTGEGMRHLIAEAGIDHVVLGTDYPFPWNTAPVDHVMSIPGLSDEDRIKILGDGGETTRDRGVGDPGLGRLALPRSPPLLR